VNASIIDSHISISSKNKMQGRYEVKNKKSEVALNNKIHKSSKLLEVP
jgi:hypothetical protein